VSKPLDGQRASFVVVLSQFICEIRQLLLRAALKLRKFLFKCIAIAVGKSVLYLFARSLDILFRLAIFSAGAQDWGDLARERMRGL